MTYRHVLGGQFDTIFTLQNHNKRFSVASMIPSHGITDRFIVSGISFIPWREPYIQSENGWLYPDILTFKSFMDVVDSQE